MPTNRPRSLMGRQAGVGLAAGSGGTLDVDLNELSAVDADVASDSIPVIDATDDSTGKEAIADIVSDVAGEGLAASDGVLSVDLDEFGDAVLDPAVDTLPFIDESATGDPGKLESVADFVGAIMGDGMVVTDGVAAVDPDGSTVEIDPSGKVSVKDDGLGIAHAAEDNVGSIFFIAKEVDFGTALAVDEKLTDAMPANGKLIGVQGVITEVFNGDVDSIIKISTVALGAAAMCSDIVVDKDAGSGYAIPGMAFGVIPNADGSEVAASGGDVYAYRGEAASCSTGKMRFLLWFQKTAAPT